MEIKKIKKLSLAGIAASLYALFGFIITFSIFIYSLSKVILEKETSGKLAGYIFINLGLDFLISLAVAVGASIVGWVIGFLVSGFYNFSAGSIGGVKIEMADESGRTVVLKPEEKKQELFKY